MMWKRPVSKFKNVEGDDHNRHPSIRLSHSAEKLVTLSVSESWLVWTLDDGAVVVAPNLPDLSAAPRGLPGAPAALSAALSPFRGPVTLLACVSESSLLLRSACGPEAFEAADVGASTCLPLPFAASRAPLAWNASAEAVLAVCGAVPAVAVADAAAPAILWQGEVAEVPSDATWDPMGGVLAVALSNGQLIRCDPRNKTTEQIFDSKFASGARTVWTSDPNHILVSGSDSMREREVRLYDIRSPTSSVGRMSCGRGLSPIEMVYDSDTGMLFCYARKDPSIFYAEVLAEGADPLCFRSKAMLSSPIFAAASAPRWTNDLMQCEVLRLWAASGDRICQNRFRVPRKSYTEFFPDVFELAFLGEPALSNTQWLEGGSFLRKRAHLTPSMQAKLLTPEQESEEAICPGPEAAPAPPRAATPPPVSERAAASRRVVHIERGSAFKHVQGKLSQRCDHVPLQKALESRVPTECDLLVASARYLACHVVGASALELHDRKDLSRVTILENGSPLQYFAFDHLTPTRLAVGCSDGRVRIWTVAEDDAADLLRDPDLILGGHNAKISLLLFHRAVANLLVTVAFDGDIFFWDLANPEAPMGSLSASGPVLALSWSPDGCALAGIDEAGHLCVWPDPRSQPESRVTSPAAVTSPRGGRIVWCQDAVLTSGFRGNKRLMTSLRVDPDAVTMSAELEIDTTSPAVLTLCADVDKGLVLAVGRGDHTVRAFDVSSGALCEVASYSSEVQLQGLALFSPYECDVTRQEVAKGMLLTQTSLQPITFVVPRVKTEYFHDDLFPDCSTPPGPVTDAANWWQGGAGGGAAVSLRPAGMGLYSEWRREEDERQKQKQLSFTPRTEAARTEMSEKQRQEKLVESMKGILNSNALPAYNTHETEGVDSDEWDD